VDYSGRGRTVWVTGAANGVGRGVALHLAKQGWHVGMLDIDAENLREAAQEAEAAGGTVHAVEGDVSSEADLARAVAAFDEKLGPVYAVINNAVYSERATVLDMSATAYRRALEVGLVGYYIWAQAAARSLVARNVAGCIINMGSGSAERGMPSTTGYASGKGGILALTRVLALDLAQYGIRVNTVTVGPMLTKFFTGFLEGDQVGLDARLARIPLGRFGEIEDVVTLFDYLLSDGALWTTAALFHVDGGANNAALVKSVKW